MRYVVNLRGRNAGINKNSARSAARQPKKQTRAAPNLLETEAGRRFVGVLKDVEGMLMAGRTLRAGEVDRFMNELDILHNAVGNPQKLSMSDFMHYEIGLCHGNVLTPEELDMYCGVLHAFRAAGFPFRDPAEVRRIELDLAKIKEHLTAKGHPPERCAEEIKRLRDLLYVHPPGKLLTK